MQDGPTLHWREVVEKNHSTLVDELSATLDAISQAERVRTATEIDRGRRETGETLNRSIRRLRAAASPSAVFEILSEVSAAHASKVVVVAIEKDQANEPSARLVAHRGISGFNNEEHLIIPLSSAAAIRTVVETRDPVTAAPSPGEISSPIDELLASPSGKVYLFPLTGRSEVVAVLLASGSVEPAVMELLTGAAGLKLESVSAGIEKTANIQKLETTEKTEAPVGWNELSAEDQKLHLQAQRVARVKVAELRLYHSDELRRGVAERNIYGVLKNQIEPIRTSFLQTFLSKSKTMVDYLHLELLRGLAHDDDRLLGETYPGPMV